MLLAIDIGNSTVFMGVIDSGRVTADFTLPTNKALKPASYRELIINMLECKSIKKEAVSDVIISSVVPELDAVFKRLAIRIFNVTPYFVTRDTNLGIKVCVENPHQVGADRLVNACAAHFIVKDSVIVIDFGTATTFDYVTKSGEFTGGVIAPGVYISIEALFRRTSKLPPIELIQPQRVIGRDTVSAMQSGIYNGYIGLVENIVSKMKKEIKVDARVLATGGACGIFRKNLTGIIDSYDEKLILKGLSRIYNMNSSVIL